MCVFITAVPVTKLFTWGEGDSGGHVLRETTSRGLCGRGSIGAVTYEAKRKGEILLRNLHRRKKIFFFIYDVIVEQFFLKRPTIHY